MFRSKSSADTLALLASKAISTNVMVADNNFNIVFMNESVAALLREAEADLRKELPKFDVSTLIGSNIDVFHKNPAHQRRLLEGLNSQLRASIKVGKWTFSTNGIATAGMFGIPTLGFGPGDEVHAHTPEDQCPIEHLTIAAKFYAAFSAAFVGKSS